MRTTYAIGLGLILLNAPAPAQQPAALPNLREALLGLDADGDRAIGRDEIPESALAAFDRLRERGDANKNGRLEFEELRTLGQKAALALGGLGSGASPAERFRAMDRDGDGKVSKDEFLGPAPLFARIDADKDGVLIAEEVRKFAAANAPSPERLKAMDRDGDGKVSREEFVGPAPQFRRLDSDGDGFITKEEAAKAPGADAPKPAPDDPKPEAPRAKAKAKAAALHERLKAMDQDGDGRITREEFKGRPALFERLDADKDGVLSPGELTGGKGKPKKQAKD